MALKLSEAIIEGAKLRPQGFGDYFQVISGRANQHCSCVYGAAAEGVGFDLAWANRRRRVLETLLKHFPEIFIQEATHPVLGHSEQIYQIGLDLNDREHWKRETIAAWLAGEGL